MLKLFFKLNMNKIMPYSLDWGEAFVESYNTGNKKATLIYNFNFDSGKLIEDYFNYSIAHLYWVNNNLPSGSSINAIYDLRGQNVDADDVAEFEKAIKNHLSKIDLSLKVDLTFHK